MPKQTREQRLEALRNNLTPKEKQKYDSFATERDRKSWLDGLLSKIEADEHMKAVEDRTAARRRIDDAHRKNHLGGLLLKMRNEDKAGWEAFKSKWLTEANVRTHERWLYPEVWPNAKRPVRPSTKSKKDKTAAALPEKAAGASAGQN